MYAPNMAAQFIIVCDKGAAQFLTVTPSLYANARNRMICVLNAYENIALIPRLIRNAVRN